jgi:putative inorganic carbon (HCO3(-)) transporter
LKSLASWLVDREIWPTIVGVALATFTRRWAPWGLALLALTWLVRWLGRGRPSVRTPIDGAVVGLLLALPLSFWAATDRGATFVAVARLLAGLALAYGLANWASVVRDGRARLSLLALGLAGMGLGLALYSLVAVSRPSPGKAPYVPGDVFEQAPVEVEDKVNPNVMAGALVVALPYPLAMLLLASPAALPPVRGAAPRVLAWLVDARPVRWAWFGLAAAAVAALLVLTKSRGAWVAEAIALVVLLAHRWRGVLWSIPVALLALGLVLWWLGPAALLDALAPGGDGLEQWMSRVEIWSRAIYMLQDFPFTGAGAGAFGHVADTLYPFLLRGPGAGVPHAHNLFLQVAVDLGLPGLVAYLAILLLALWSAVDGARRHRRAGECGLARRAGENGLARRGGQRALSALAWAGVASLVAMCVHGMVDATTWIVGRGAFVPWAAIGAILAVHRAAVHADCTGEAL